MKARLFASFLGVLVGAVVTEAYSRRGTRFADAGMYTDAEHFPFLQGVASGDPLHDSVLLWTRVDSGSGASENVEWALWDPADPAQSLQNPLKSGSVDTDGSRDFTVNIQVSGLSAGHAYVYQFKDSAGRVSVVGKTRTAAAESEQARVAVLSCTSAWNGYMNYYRHIANRNDLDAVIHLGDYIYPQNSELERFPLGMCYHEWWRSANYFGKDNGYTPEDNPEPALQNLSRKFNCNGSMLEQYRWIYEYYHLDPDFRLARQNHPFIVILDNHDAEADTPFYNGALQAAMEWIPMRHHLYNSSSGETYLDMKREFTLGKDLVHLIAIDTRREQDETGLLGAAQAEWLDYVFANSTNKQYRMIATSTEFMPFALNGLPEAANAAFAVVWSVFLLCMVPCWVRVTIRRDSKIQSSSGEVSKLESGVSASSSASFVQPGDEENIEKEARKCMSPVQGLRAASWPLRLCTGLGTFLFLSCTIGWIYGAVFLNSKLNSNAIKNLDGNEGKWEGQPQSRQALFDQLVAHGVDSNNIWISGDMHYSCAADVVQFNANTTDLLDYDPDDFTKHKRYGVEFLPTSGSRGNIDEIAAGLLSVSQGVIDFVSWLADVLILKANPHFRHFEGSSHGYGTLDITRQAVKAQFFYFPINTIANEPILGKTLYVKDKQNRWEDEL